MKNYLRSFCRTLLISTLLGIPALLPQFAAVAQGTKIIAIDDYMAQPDYITSYNYTTQQYDTLYELPAGTFTVSSYTAMDAYNQRFFFMAHLPGFPLYSIFCYDIPSDSLLFLFGNNSPYIDFDMNYDCFYNGLLFTANDSMILFQLDSSVFINLGFAIHYFSNQLTGFPTAYNQMEQESFITIDITGNSTFHYTTIKADSIATVTDTLAANQPGILFFTRYYSPTQTYYGLNGNFVGKINSSFAAVDSCLALPPDFNGILNFQRSVLDEYNGKFIFPYYNSMNVNRLVIYDIVTNQISNVYSTFPEHSNGHQLNAMLLPGVKQHNNTLTASYGSAYQWYLDNIQIPNATSQRLVVSAPGNYMVNVQFMDGRNAMSDSVMMTSASLHENIVSNDELLAYPMPFDDVLFLKSNSNKSIWKATFYDAQGMEVLTQCNYSGSTEMKIQCSDIQRTGIYTVIVEDILGNCWQKKLVKTK